MNVMRFLTATPSACCRGLSASPAARALKRSPRTFGPKPRRRRPRRGARGDGGLECCGDVGKWGLSPPIDHAFTHFDLRLKPIQVQCGPQAAVREGAERLWYQLNAPPRVGLPQPILRLFERLRTTGMA